MMKRDQRVGHTPPGASVEWPAVDINGQPYERPATTVALDSEHFVVVPIGFADWPLVEELRQQVAPKGGLKKAVADERNNP